MDSESVGYASKPGGVQIADEPLLDDDSEREDDGAEDRGCCELELDIDESADEVATDELLRPVLDELLLAVDVRELEDRPLLLLLSELEDEDDELEAAVLTALLLISVLDDGDEEGRPVLLLSLQLLLLLPGRLEDDEDEEGSPVLLLLLLLSPHRNTPLPGTVPMGRAAGRRRRS